MKIRFRLEGVIDFAVIAFMLYCFLLPSASVTISPWLVLGVGLVYTAYVALFFNNRQVRRFIIGYIALIMLIALLYLLLTTSTSNLTIVERYITKFGQWFKIFFPILLFYRFTKFKSGKTQTLLLVFAVFMIMVVAWNSFGVLKETPYAARQWSDFDDIKLKNAVTYEYVYAFSALVPLAYWCLTTVKNVYIRILSAVALIAFFSLLIAAQYTIAIVLAVIACFLCFYQKHKSLLVIFVSALIGVVTIFFLPTILMWISTLFESETISIRFKELAIFMKGGEVSADGDMASRMTVYRKCFEYFFKSPIRGNVSVPFNTHSTFLGIMCDLGIIGMIPTFYISFTIHKRIYEIAGDCHIKKAFLPVYVLWVLLGLLNPVHAALPLNMVVWFLIPATMYFLIEKHKESSELKNDANG